MKEASGSRAGGAAESGFRAHLTGASLADLVQMECLARTTQVVRVVSGDDVGYLYFQAGAIVHAMSSGAIGEAAALEILGWDRGSFEPCNAGWPSSATITRPWQALLLTAATQRDESRRRTVVDFPRDRTSPAMTAKSSPGSSSPPQAGPSNRSASQPADSQAPQAGTPSSGPNSMRGIERAVRLETDGKVLSSRGQAEELAAVTAYTMRIAALVGERLGMEDLRAVECTVGNARRLFYVEKNGNYVGVEATPDADLGMLRQKLGL
jgi:hypothetical protein